MTRAEGEAARHALFLGYRHLAARREIDWVLTEEEFTDLTKQSCYYCGAGPSKVYPATKACRYNGAYTYNGLDRVDNSKGYATGNVVPCCLDCNQAKGKMAQGEFEAWIVKVYNHLHD